MLAGLEDLNVESRGNEITDAGLAHLEAQAGLRCSSSIATRSWDAGLVHLFRGLTRLKALALGSTQATPEGRAALMSALPDLKISDIPRGPSPAAKAKAPDPAKSAPAAAARDAGNDRTARRRRPRAIG